MISRLADAIMRRRAEALLARLRSHLDAVSTPWLDLGCGSGHNAHVFRAEAGLEILEADVVNLKRSGQAPLLMEQGRVPLPDRAVATSFICFVLSYAEDPAALLREARRVSDGHLLLFQSICREPRFRRLLALREYVEGDLAWWVGHLTGQVRGGRSSMCMRQVFVRDELIALVEAQGWRLRSFEPEGRSSSWLGRDLMIFEGV